MDRNLQTEAPNVTRAMRESLLGHPARVIWLTGLSASGKSTIARRLDEHYHSLGRLAFILDGDIVRTGLCNDLGFDERSRSENIRRVSEVAKMMLNTGVTVISAFIAPYNSAREKLREELGDSFVEVHVDCPLEVYTIR